jgi:hypothetical protein
MKCGASDKLYNQIQHCNWLGNMKCTYTVTLVLQIPHLTLSFVVPNCSLCSCWRMLAYICMYCHCKRCILCSPCHITSLAVLLEVSQIAITFHGHSVKLTSHPLWEWVKVAKDSCSSLGRHRDGSGVLFFHKFLAVRLQLIIILYHMLPPINVEGM